MSDLLKNEDLKEMSVEAFLAMSPDEVAAFAGFKKSPMGVYTGTLAIECEMNDEETEMSVKMKVDGIEVVELIEGVDGEPAEEIQQDDIPADITYVYQVPTRGQQFKTDWNDVAVEANGGTPCETFAEVLEILDGKSIQFTNALTRSKAKKDSGTVKKGDVVVYQNIRNITLLSV